MAPLAGDGGTTPLVTPENGAIRADEERGGALNEAQRQGARMMMEVLLAGSASGERAGAPQGVLCGYAGTGKTYTVRAVLQTLRASSAKRVAVLAPTHKALAQVTQALGGVTGMTMHAALGLRVARGDDGEEKSVRGGAAKMHDFDALIVDEASMISEEMYQELQRQRGGRSVIWVGDPAQLPPVKDEKARSVVFDLVERQVRLQEIVRQGEGSAIIRASMRIRAAIEEGRAVTLDELRECAGEELVFASGGIETVASWTASAIEHGLDARAVAWTNKAVDRLSGMVRAARRGPGAPKWLPGDVVTFGRRYAFTRRRMDLQSDGVVWREDEVAIPTSTEGVVSRSSDVSEHNGVPVHYLTVRTEGCTIDAPVPVDIATHNLAIKRMKRIVGDLWKRTGRSHQWRRAHAQLEFASERYADVRHTYATTAHKAQGSTYDAAIIHWSDCARMADRDPVGFNRLLYVAITRASRYVVVVS